MKEPDSQDFIKAVKREFGDLLNDGVFRFVSRTSVPEHLIPFPAVWAMKRKRRVKTREIYKWKARLNLDGSKQMEGRDYDQTYAPVVTWESIRLLLAMNLRNKWKTRQIDYVLAFPQAPVDRECYMEIPKGIRTKNKGDYVLKVEKNIYGQKQAGRVWNQHLVRKLVNKVGFTQSEHDECLFYKGNVVYLLYTDDSILTGPDDAELDKIMQEIADAGLDITQEEGGLEDFLGVNIEQTAPDTYHLSQPHLIEQILKDLRLRGDDVAVKGTPACASKMLGSHPESKPFDGHFNYRSVIGKLNYLEKSTRPDLGYSVHQCARFSANPKTEHGNAVKHIGRYLRGTRDKGIYLKVSDVSFEVWADADFSGNWRKEEALEDSDTARSRSGYIITYLGCPILWKSQLQTEIALSSCESEYICLSQALKRTIPLMEIVQEMKKLGYNVGETSPTVRCTLFEDNSGAMTLANAPAMRPRTKHINNKYHHFRSFVANGQVTILAVKSENQCADMLTKPNNVTDLTRHRKRVMGW